MLRARKRLPYTDGTVCVHPPSTGHRPPVPCHQDTALLRRLCDAAPMSDRQKIYRLALAVDLDARTVARWLDGGRVLPSVRAALTAAAKRLKIEGPAPRQEAA